jgi:hypothetical protein
MDLLKTSAMLEALKLKLQKYGKIGDLQPQVVDSVLYLLLSIWMMYYQEGCNIMWHSQENTVLSPKLIHFGH